MSSRSVRKANRACDGLDEMSPISTFPTNPMRCNIGYYNKAAKYRLNPDSVDEIEASTAYLLYEAWKFREVGIFEDDLEFGF